MPWRGPRFEGELPTLGYGVLDALSDALPSPADDTTELVFTPEQGRLVLAWYTFDPETLEFVYRRGCAEMAKGWGKSPLFAAIGIAELALEVIPAGWDAKGEPVARPWGTGEAPPPWVQIAAVSEDQTDNTYEALFSFLTANDARASAALGIDQGRTRLYLRGRPGRLEPVTAAFGSREGQRLTFAILDETHLWTKSNRGVKLAATIRRNVAKMGGRTFETTNAPELGEHSVAEQTGVDAEAGEPGIMFYSRRARVDPDPNWPDEQMMAELDHVYGDARWVERTRLVAEIRDPATEWPDALRFYFNVRSPGVGRAVDPRLWDGLAAPGDVASGTRIGIGFDGSISRDATVLRGCTAEGYSFLLGAWVRPPGEDEWTVPRSAVEATIEEAFGRFDVGLMLCDPPKWWTEIERWAERWGEDTVVAFDTNQARRFAPAVDRWLTAMREGTHTHDGDPLTTAHVRAAHLRKTRVNDPEDDSRTLYVLVKGDDRRLIDAAVADVLAHEAAVTMPVAPPGPMVAFV